MFTIMASRTQSGTRLRATNPHEVLGTPCCSVRSVGHDEDTRCRVHRGGVALLESGVEGWRELHLIAVIRDLDARLHASIAALGIANSGRDQLDTVFDVDLVNVDDEQLASKA